MNVSNQLLAMSVFSLSFFACGTNNALDGNAEATTAQFTYSVDGGPVTTVSLPIEAVGSTAVDTAGSSNNYHIVTMGGTNPQTDALSWIGVGLETGTNVLDSEHQVGITDYNGNTLVNGYTVSTGTVTITQSQRVNSSTFMNVTVSEWFFRMSFTGNATDINGDPHTITGTADFY